MALGDHVSSKYTSGATPTDSFSSVDMARAAIAGLVPMVQEVTHEITAWVTLNKQVTTPGTRVRLNASALKVRRLFVQALGLNLGLVAIGDANVVAALGTQTTPTEKGFSIPAGLYGWFEVPFYDLTDVWLDALNASDGVKALYLT